MALQGTIKDFALPDILQLIGIQRKTGILTLESGDEKVTVKFQDGQVVGADTASEGVESRLGSVLVRTGRITEAQLAEALETQRKTLQRLGHILVKNEMITSDELVEGLNVQSTQILYRLFRWSEGTYDFQAAEKIDYDRSHFVPISADSLLMEGARMVDEWPIIERRIKSETMVLRKTEAGESVNLEVEPVLDPDLDFDLDLGFESDIKPEEPEEPAEDKIELSPEECQVMALVDGVRTAREISELLNLGEFDTFRILSEMYVRKLIEAVEETKEEGPARREPMWVSRVLCWIVSGAVALLAVGGLVTLQENRLAPWTLLERAPATEKLRLYGSMARMERVERAVKLYYLDLGTFPRNAAILAQKGYVAGRDLQDPWGRPYLYQLSAGGYQLVGFDAEGEMHPELTVSRRLNAVQQMLASERPDDAAE